MLDNVATVLSVPLLGGDCVNRLWVDRSSVYSVVVAAPFELFVYAAATTCGGVPAFGSPAATVGPRPTGLPLYQR